MTSMLDIMKNGSREVTAPVPTSLVRMKATQFIMFVTVVYRTGRQFPSAWTFTTPPMTDNTTNDAMKTAEVHITESVRTLKT